MFYFVIDSYLKKQCNQKGYKVVNKVCERGTICQLQWGYSKGGPFSCKRGISSKRVRGWTSGPAEPPRINICWVPPPHPPSPPHCYKTNNLPYPLSSPEASLCLCVPRALSIFFDYCYFYRDSQREPLRIQERVPYRCQQLAAQLTVPTSFPGFSQREPRNKVAHRSTTLNLPPYRSLNSPHSVRRLDQLPFFLCFNLVLSFF